MSTLKTHLLHTRLSLLHNPPSKTSFAIMELEKVAELYDTMRKETQVKKFCDTSKIKYRETINQHYIVINRKQFTGKTRKDLIDKLFEHFCGISVTTLDEAFKEWMIWRRDNGTNSKT